MSELHISISAEPLFDIGNLSITNSMVVSWFVSVLLVLFAVTASRNIKVKGKISKIQLIAEMLVDGLYGLVKSTAGSAKARAFFPLIATFFLFILVSNWSGLLPGAGSVGILRNLHGAETLVPYLRAPTADINTTLALGLISMFFVQYYGFKHLGLGYLKKFFNFSNPINAFVGLLEIVSDVSKIISFTFRLFGNIFAGEVLLAVIAYLLPIVAPIPFLGLELFVGFIQALVFAMLSVVFFNVATISHDHEEAH